MKYFGFDYKTHGFVFVFREDWFYFDWQFAIASERIRLFSIYLRSIKWIAGIVCTQFRHWISVKWIYGMKLAQMPFKGRTVPAAVLARFSLSFHFILMGYGSEKAICVSGGWSLKEPRSLSRLWLFLMRESCLLKSTSPWGSWLGGCSLNETPML